MEREEAILSLAPKVRIAAAKMWRKLPRYVSREDLIGEGWLGAIHAVDRFDPLAGVLLSTFAEYHIRGALLDYLRRLDFIGREERRKLKIAIKVASESDIPAPIAPSLQCLHLVKPIPREDPAFARVEAAAELDTLFRRCSLTARSKDVVRRSFFAEEKLRAIGLTMGVTESMVSQIRAAALANLREAA